MPLDHPAPALADADVLVALRVRLPADRADHRVQAGAVAAAGEDSDPHGLKVTAESQRYR